MCHKTALKHMHTQRTNPILKFNELGNRTGLGNCLTTLWPDISHSTSKKTKKQKKQKTLNVVNEKETFFLFGLSCIFLLIDNDWSGSPKKATASGVADRSDGKMASVRMGCGVRGFNNGAQASWS